MSNFTPLVTKQYDFDGDNVTVVFSRLRRNDMLNAMPKYAKLTAAGDDEAATTTAVNDILNDIADKIPEYVKDFSGLLDSEGNPISIETVVEDMYFLKLCASIATDMIKESAVPGGND